MKKLVNVNVKDMMAMFVIASGTYSPYTNYDDEEVDAFEYNADIPSFIAESEEFGKFVGVRANPNLDVSFVFEEDNWKFVSYDMAYIKENNPMLYAAVVTHIYDKIINLEENM